MSIAETTLPAAKASKSPLESIATPAGPTQREQTQWDVALSCAQMGAWDWDVSGNALEWDAQMHAFFGLKPREFSGRFQDFLAMLEPSDRDRVATEMCESLKKPAGYDGEFHLLAVRGEPVRTIRARGKVHMDASGNAMHMTGVCWDATERRATEEALARRRNFFSALMDNIPDHIYFKDLNSRFIAVNRAMAEWAAVRRPMDLIGKSDFDLFTAEHAERALHDEMKIMATGDPIVNLEEKETWPNGEITWVSTTKMPLRDPHNDDRIIGTFGLSRDITEKKRGEVQLALLADEVTAKNAALEEDLETARELQAALLPQRFPRFPRNAARGEGAIHFFPFYRASAKVSGDFFDVFDIENDVAGLFICDVMGHGARAALVAAIVRTLVGSLRDTWSDPGEFLADLNTSLCAALRPSRIPLFVSASYVVADLGRGELRSAHAGHHNPVRITDAGVHSAAPLNGVKPGPALGLFES
ncbi:MAG: PAS domain-containing protein, partial [Verrucomicrobiota bacterium]|nr:PAS domain-containing protein [Verrucomicrobiota bacterium]